MLENECWDWQNGGQVDSGNSVTPDLHDEAGDVTANDIQGECSGEEDNVDPEIP